MDLLGRIVISKSGRDAGKLFVIVEKIDDNYVKIADGSLRRIIKPKKKKIKHLEFTEEINNDLKVKLNNNEKVTNIELRRILDTFEIK